MNNKVQAILSKSNALKRSLEFHLPPQHAGGLMMGDTRFAWFDERGLQFAPLSGGTIPFEFIQSFMQWIEELTTPTQELSTDEKVSS